VLIRNEERERKVEAVHRDRLSFLKCGGLSGASSAGVPTKVETGREDAAASFS
jgi:hypothetical protein